MGYQTTEIFSAGGAFGNTDNTFSAGQAYTLNTFVVSYTPGNTFIHTNYQCTSGYTFGVDHAFGNLLLHINYQGTLGYQTTEIFSAGGAFGNIDNTFIASQAFGHTLNYTLAVSYSHGERCGHEQETTNMHGNIFSIGYAVGCYTFGYILGVGG